MKGQRIEELDVLRGIAALLVILVHYTNQRLPDIVRLGVTGVDMFFMISGFAIYLSLNQTVIWKDFLISRFARLYPAYWTAMSITSIFLLVFRPDQISLTQYLVNLTMFEHFFKVKYIDDSYWTLTIELLFYICMLCVFLLKKLKNIEIIGMITVILSFIFHLTGFIFFKKQYNFLKAGLPLINYIPLFYAGILFYLIKFEGQNPFRHFGIFICLITYSFFCQRYGPAEFIINLQQHIIMACIYFLVFYLMVFNQLTFIVNKVTLFWGSISYSLYLLNLIIGNFIIDYLSKHIKLNLAFSIVVTFFLITLLAAFVTFFVERPAIRFIKLLYSNHKFKSNS